jgi:hypothetical protein
VSGRTKAKLAVAAYLCYAVAKEAVSPSPWNVHDPAWQYPRIYTGTVPAELEAIRGRVAPGGGARYDGQQPTSAEAPQR